MSRVFKKVLWAGMLFAAAGAMAGALSVPSQTMPATTSAAATLPTGGSPDPSVDVKTNSKRNDLDEQLLASAEATLVKYPPAFPVSPERRFPFLAMDQVLNDAYAVQRPPVQAYFHRRFKLALNEIRSAKIAAGKMRIWLIYNMGFIVKTASVTMAFDLIEPSHLGALAVPKELMQGMVDQCDVLFVSHQHQDHADPEVAKLFVAAGKPMLGPVELTTIDPIYQHVLPDAPNMQKSYDVTTAKGKLEVWIFPGQQEIKPKEGATASSFVQNDVFVVRTPEGLTVAHDGDQNDMASWRWIDHVQEHVGRVDVLMYNTWVNPIYRYIKGFKPSLILMGHMNELGHFPGSRYEYWKAIDKSEKSKVPCMVMGWGESIDYPLAR